MKKLAWVLTASMLTGAWGQATHRQPVDWVNEYIGTGSGPIGYGGTMPSVTPPFGMTDWTAQTRQNKLGVTSYKYEDTSISGFMATHQPAIWMGDYGYLTVMPEIGEVKTGPDERRLPFRHADELVSPDYYSVWMDAGAGKRIHAEMTATDRCGYLRFTFPSQSKASVLVESSRPGGTGQISVSTTGEIAGYNADRTDTILGPLKLANFRGYFVVQFRQPGWHTGSYGRGDGSGGGYEEFRGKSPKVVDVRIGTSFISLDQARANLNAEIPNWNFNEVRKRLRDKWNTKLAMIEVKGATDDQRCIIYTGLYHALLYPREFSEYGKYYSAFDDKVHDGTSYTAYSIWDTFRAEWGLLTLLAPERIDGMVNALLQDYQEGGWLPKWPNPSYTNIMIGTHADSLIAEAMRKGFHGFDYDLAWHAVLKDATVPPEGDTTRRWYDRESGTPYEARGGLTYSKVLGYVPNDKTAEAASRTLEDAYDDWCVAQIAKQLGQEKDYEYFLSRAGNYKNIYNSSTGFMQARDSDGNWAGENEGWTEGNHWVYTFAVMHDLGGLLNLMGGEDHYNHLLDEHFSGGHNQHKNEPSHHYGYLYDFSGEPWKTQAKVREIAAAEYANLPSGIDGDDDCGQMSAWYLFTALGFYPVNPASGDFMIGSPLFSEMTLNLPSGKHFRVIAEGNSASNVYIQSATLNSHFLNIPLIHWEDILAGGELHFVMGPQPSQWSSEWRPPAANMRRIQ